MTLAKIGAAALWVYTKHILVFTIGAFLGAFEALAVLMALGWGPQ